MSLNRIADVLREEGNRDAALVNYRKALDIAEKLAADDPGQPQLQTDLVVSYVRLAEMDIERRPNLDNAHAVLTRLGDAGLLTAAQEGWIGIVEAQLAALDGGLQQPPSAVRPAPPVAEEGGVSFVQPRRRSILDWLWRR